MSERPKPSGWRYMVALDASRKEAAARRAHMDPPRRELFQTPDGRLVPIEAFALPTASIVFEDPEREARARRREARNAKLRARRARARARRQSESDPES